MTTKEFSVAAYTPNGREVRLMADGLYHVQPANDNYWIACQSVAEALYKFANPHDDFAPAAAAAIAEMIVESWQSDWSIGETAANGLSECDREEADEQSGGDRELSESIVREVVRICRARAHA